MNPPPIEASYPITFRQKDALLLGQHLSLRHSVELIGIKRVGISNFLRFFLYHKDIVPTYIGNQKNHLFIPIDLNDLVETELSPFWILTLKRLVDSTEKSNIKESDKKKISLLFLDSIQLQDLFLTIDNLRKALSILIKNNILPTIFLIRFDRLKNTLTSQFLNNLQGLVDATNQKLAFVFTSFRSLDEIAPGAFSRHQLSVFSHLTYLKPASAEDTRIIFETYEKKYHIKPSNELLTEILKLCAGHAQYLHLALIFLNQNPKSTSFDLISNLTSDERINLLGEEIWESLKPEEQGILVSLVGDKKVETTNSYLWQTGLIDQNNQIFNPIFQDFAKRQINKKSNGKSPEFTKKEQALFDFLKANENKICDREQIIENVWPESQDFGVSDWTIDRLVARLRTKLKDQNSQYVLQTVKTRGFKLIS